MYGCVVVLVYCGETCNYTIRVRAFQVCAAFDFRPTTVNPKYDVNMYLNSLL